MFTYMGAVLTASRDGPGMIPGRDIAWGPLQLVSEAEPRQEARNGTVLI